MNMDNSIQSILESHPSFLLCLQYMSVNDIANLRLVSTKINEMVSGLPRFVSNERRITILDKSYWDCNNWFIVSKALPWYNVYIKKNTPNGISGLTKRIWLSKSSTISKLTFYDVKICCEKMCHLLNQTPAVREVHFEYILFNGDLNKYPWFPKNIGVELLNSVPIHAYCLHVLPQQRENEEYIQLTRTNVPLPTIEKLSFQNQPAIPICLFDNLITRTRGTLVDLSIRESLGNIRVGPVYIDIFGFKALRHPELACPKLLELMRRSSTTLKRLELYDNFGFGFFTHLANEIIRNDEFRLIDLILGSSPLETLYSTSPHLACVPDNVNLFQLVERLSSPFLQHLSLQFNYEPGVVALVGPIGLDLINLHTVKIKVYWDEDEQEMDMNQLQLLQLNRTVKTYCLSVPKWQTVLPLDLDDDFLHALQDNELECFCTSIMLDFGALEQVERIFRSKQFSGLRKLCIWKGKYVRDYVVQTIIQACPSLEELTVSNNSERLHDFGITGLDETFLQLIRTNENIGILDPTPNENQTGSRLSELRNLRILRLPDCECITDVSLCYALEFPNLITLELSGCNKITDTGLIRLAHNNPSINTLIIHHIPGVTIEGLEAFISASRSIKFIEMTKIPNISNYTGPPLNPNFYEIVKVKKEKGSTAAYLQIESNF